MKSLLLASIITAAAALSSGVAAHAATTVTTTQRGLPPNHRMQGTHHMDRPCSTRTVRRHRHGRVVMEKVTTCP